MASRLRSPSIDFRAVRDGLNSGPFYFDIQLSTPRSDFVLPISGNSFYIDANPNDGNALCAFRNYDNKNADVEFYVSPGFIYRGGFTELRLSWAAQSGKKIRIVYGTDIDFQPGSVAQLALAGQVDLSANSKVPLQIGTTANSNGNVLVQALPLAGGIASLVYTGSPSNATLLQRVQFSVALSANNGVYLFSAATAPALGNLPDGPCICMGVYDQASGIYNGLIDTPLAIPAGRNLYMVATQSTTTANNMYTQLGRLT